VSNVVTIPIPNRRIESDPDGFQALCWLHQELQSNIADQIIIEMSNLHWIDAHLAAPLMVILRIAQRSGKTVRFLNLNEAVRVILRKNGFLRIRAQDTYNTAIPLCEFSLDDGVQFSMYAKKHLDRREMPKMSKSLREKFFEGLDELFANAALHSNSITSIVVGGQSYPNSNRLNFSISDGGRGIQGSIRDALGRTIAADDAIDWAMAPDNTTRQGDIPGGLGLQIVRQFIRLNRGKLVVMSNEGFWMQSGERVSKRRLPLAFPGTAVVLQIDTSDRHSHSFHAPKPQDIW
jgi:anti-anti-sigma regulatory factor